MSCSRLDVMGQQVPHQLFTFKASTQRPRSLSTLPIRLYAESNDESTHMCMRYCTPDERRLHRIPSTEGDTVSDLITIRRRFVSTANEFFTPFALFIYLPIIIVARLSSAVVMRRGYQLPRLMKRAAVSLLTGTAEVKGQTIICAAGRLFGL